MYSMTVTLVMVFAILAALVLGFLCGRIWQIRRDEYWRGAPVSRYRPPRAFRAQGALKQTGRRPHQQHVAIPQLTIGSTRAAQPTCSRNRRQPLRRG
jgi:hypothetical protein